MQAKRFAFSSQYQSNPLGRPLGGSFSLGLDPGLANEDRLGAHQFRITASSGSGERPSPRTSSRGGSLRMLFRRSPAVSTPVPAQWISGDRVPLTRAHAGAALSPDTAGARRSETGWREMTPVSTWRAVSKLLVCSCSVVWTKTDSDALAILVQKHKPDQNKAGLCGEVLIHLGFYTISKRRRLTDHCA